MRKLNFLILLTMIAAAPALAQTAVTVTFPSNLSCTVAGAVTSTFPVTSAAFSISGPALTGTASAGKPTFSAFQITKPSDSCSVPLFSALVLGSHIAGPVTINYYSTATVTAITKPVVTFTLTNVFVTALNFPGTEAVETFSLSFEAIKLTDPATGAVFSWNLQTNSSI